MMFKPEIFISKYTVVGVIVVAATLTGCSGEDSPEQPAEKLTPSAGELVYIKNCKVCHAQGLNGAPILGNQAMWGERADQGIDVLVNHATNGFGLMPKNLGRNDLDQEKIRLATEYMLSKL